MRRSLGGVAAVLAYLVAGVMVARYAHRNLRHGLDDPFAFGVVLLWPVAVVIAGAGLVVRWR